VRERLLIGARHRFTTNSFSSAGERPSMSSGMPEKNLTRAALRIS
jgi:hypothetical protein